MPQTVAGIAALAYAALFIFIAFRHKLRRHEPMSYGMGLIFLFTMSLGFGLYSVGVN